MKTNEVAQHFVDECNKYNWNIEIRSSSVIAIRKNFTPGSEDEFTKCESEANYLLSILPLTGGSTWGTDGGSVGGHVGLSHGSFTLCKSGNNGKRLTQALSKLGVQKRS